MKNNQEKNNERFAELDKIIKDQDEIIKAMQKRIDDLEQMANNPVEAQGSDTSIPPELSVSQHYCLLNPS